MTTRIYLVRHGATELSAEDRFVGETDVALSDTGRRQATALAQRLATVHFSAVYASPLSRTRETAGILAQPHRLEVTPVAGLREISHGHWEGKSRAEVEAAYPTEYAKWEHDPFTFAPPGGETGLSVTARALPALIEILDQHGDQHVLVVSHKATIRLLLSSILGFDARKYRDRLDQSPAALNLIDFKNVTHARLMLFNDTSHYATADALLPDMNAGRLSKVWDQ